MKCPYCLSPVDAEASVCKTCTKDLYLFKPLLQKLEALEVKLAAFPDRESAEQRIADLESQIEDLQTQREIEQEAAVHWRTQVLQYLGLPLVILLLGHALIIMVYDLSLVYLRVLSIAVPMPFAYALFSRRKRPITVWFMGTVVLAVAAVLGMSTITAVIDDVSVLPSSPIEWREFIEYSASISFSFLTGMLLGGMAYLRRHRSERERVSPWLAAIISGLGDGKLSPEALRKIMQNINQFGSTAVALGTTAVSIYTGLKSIL
jgi:hypothetical protein